MKSKYSTKIPWTHEQFLERVDTKHPDRDWEIVGIYEHNMIPILVRDRFGDCLIRPNTMLNNNSKPSVKTAIDKTQYTINRFLELHGDKYDYSEFTYLGTKSKSTIICPNGHRFPMCANDHLNGYGCRDCATVHYGNSRRSNTEDFILKAKILHPDKYDYSKVDYKSATEEVKILCPQHGEFSRTPNHHLLGRGCSICAEGRKSYTKSDSVKRSSDDESKVYVIKCKSVSENFFKIGVTKEGTERRFKKLPYMFEEIYLHDKFSGNAYDLEELLLVVFNDHRYMPQQKFGGYTECFSLDLPVEEIISYLNTF